MNLPRSLLILFISLMLILGLTLNTFAQQTQIEPAIPAVLQPCLPRSLEQVELLGQVQQEQQKLYLLGAVAGDHYWELLVQQDEAGCLLIKGQQDTEPLSAYIPLEVAQQLALQRYQRRIEEAGGLEAFQKGFTEHMAQQSPGEITYLAPEAVWALQQLGVEIPAGSYQIRQPRTAPNFDQLSSPPFPLGGSMNLRLVRNKLKWFSFGAIALIAIAVALSATGLADRQASANNAAWNFAAQSSPSGLMTQVRAEHLSPDAAVDTGQMKVWKIQQSGQTQPLYLIDSRVANAASSTNPLCGASGCAFFGYLATASNYQQVLNIYLDPRLPPHVALIDATDELQSGLPVLKVNQLEGDRIQQLTLTFDGTQYQVTDTQLSPQRYE